jgi:3-deoxy-7-phosphoheptulonate synthase
MDTAAVSPEVLAYPLVARGLTPDSTVIEVRGRRIGDGFFGLVAGPCTVETREQTLETARAVAAAGATVLRGGAFKPRSSPYAFQGLGAKGLEILAEARDETGLPIVTELLDPRDVAAVAEVADVIQIGARNMHNFTSSPRSAASRTRCCSNARRPRPSRSCSWRPSTWRRRATSA